MLRKLILAACATVFLTACQTASGVSGYSPDNKPTVLTSLSLSEARTKANAIFTRPSLAFHVTSETPDWILFSKTMPASVNDNNPLKERTKGDPLNQVALTFRTENGKTRVTADNWLVLNPKEANKDVFNLLATPDGARLQNKLNELR
ncbi:hypothetical protein GFK91_31415 (plasmid) [Roseibium aggregatum]|uniref:hypothetical protein n=1 Tax=Roseibium aggregatum TaxID=187304 RepID=UPI001E5FB579|nr:hypothetical protein [Roseibium aggregatum]UES60226.1 hypothetical protein GFK91_31415 [Roseibium aggregatum]